MKNDEKDLPVNVQQSGFYAGRAHTVVFLGKSEFEWRFVDGILILWPAPGPSQFSEAVNDAIEKAKRK
jgi:hypothetical protein